MRFLVIGAGAVGSFVGASLARAGYAVTLVGRGPHLRAIAAGGIAVRSGRATFGVRLPAVETVDIASDADIVLVAVKAHQLGPIAADLGALGQRGATIVTMQNGIPFWFFEGFGGPLEGVHLASVDPGGRIADRLRASSIVACVVNAGTRIPRPGVVEQVGDRSYALGAVAGSLAPLEPLTRAFVEAGLDAGVADDVRDVVWQKLVGNAVLNPVSALVRATTAEIVDAPAVRALLAEAMGELVALGAALGFGAGAPIPQRLERTRGFGDQRTSMLQDVDAGRPLEIGPIVGAAVEIGTLAGVPLPATRRLHALVELLDRKVRAAEPRHGMAARAGEDGAT